MDYRVFVTDDAKVDLDSYVWYLVTQKRNTQAAANLLGDYDATIDELSVVAGSLKYCENEKLKTRGYKRINFKKHSYFMLYRLENDVVYVDHIYHFLQDYENKIM